MITAIDTSVILDVLTDDRSHSLSSESALRKASAEGKLIICATVVAELSPALGDEHQLSEFLEDWQLEFSPMRLESAVLAGRYYRTYLSRSGTAKRVLADFLIGAHSVFEADRLLARDRGYLRDYFTDLTVWEPAVPSAGSEGSQGVE